MSAPELATIARCIEALSPEHRQEVVRKAVALVERERRALLPAAERQRADLVDQFTLCMDLLAETNNPADRRRKRIQRAIWRDLAKKTHAKMVALGIDYFGTVQ